MTREIDIVLKAAAKGCAVVEKLSHALWTGEELQEAANTGRYSDSDALGPPTPHLEVSAPFPGCLQRHGATADWSRYYLVGQTEHFLVFAPVQEEPAVRPKRQ